MKVVSVETKSGASTKTQRREGSSSVRVLEQVERLKGGSGDWPFIYGRGGHGRPITAHVWTLNKAKSKKRTNFVDVVARVELVQGENR